MKRVLLAGIGLFALAIAAQPVAAADVPTARPVLKAPVAAPIFDWTGWYGGANYGTGVSQVNGGTQINNNTEFDRASTGHLIGLQGGYNWQFSPNWVVGLEGDIGWLGIDRKTPNWSNILNEFGVETNWYGTLRGRLGYANGPSLFYLTGGGTLVSVRNHYDNYLGATLLASRSEVAGGWTAGWGIETMLGGNWSATAEYLYVDAGSQTVVNSASFDPNANFRNRFHLFRKGLNYRFGGSAPALPAHNWSGFYAGWNAGVGVSHVHADSTVVSGVADIADAAFTGGLQAGYNWQLAPHWVAGVEADINWLGVDRTYSEWVNSIVFGVKADWYSTLRVRLAYSAGPALLYVTGGAAVVNVKNVFDQVITSTNARSETAFGWTIGGGIEAALGNNWTAKSEYLYIDAGNQAVPAPSIGALVVGDFDNRFHVFRFGLNYRFATGKAPGPVVTKY